MTGKTNAESGSPAFNFHTAPYRDAAARLVASKLSISERQRLVRELLAPYPIFDEMVEFAARFHHPAKPDDLIGADDVGDRDIGLPDVGTIGGLLGETRVGKTAVCTYYRSKWPVRITEDGERYPVVYIPASDDMTPTSMAELVYFATGAQSVPGKLKTPVVIRNAIKRLVRLECELLIIDDAQYLFFGRTRTEMKHFMSFLKLLADSQALNVLLVGEEKIDEFIGGHAFLSGRGGFPHKMLRPLGDSVAEFEMFRMLMKKVDARLPFRELSGLDGVAVAGDLYRYSDGMIGRVMNLVRYAAVRAIAAGSSRILLEHLYEEAALRPKAGDDYEYFRKGGAR
ncbi:ATP-binding protein [Rhizobium sp. CB3171]|uniref:ATP-binding protein n=1 Tax=Rhizobium sp. CB3171 TaxID=3039157 RepID=UPI0024B1772D|nr:ATP-binding protein [Rhizobium sp. CB3171]WFU00705.1 ATP-binding protein [Rhizobium sp. CB3171]